jgi:hypothetical protein
MYGLDMPTRLNSARSRIPTAGKLGLSLAATLPNRADDLAQIGLTQGNSIKPRPLDLHLEVRTPRGPSSIDDVHQARRGNDNVDTPIICRDSFGTALCKMFLGSFVEDALQLP